MATEIDALTHLIPKRATGVEGALAEIQAKLKTSPARGGVTKVKRIPARDAQYAPFPEGLSPDLAEILKGRGIEKLYTHQAEAFRLAREGRNLVVVTPTASGKTLCYNLPILNALVENPETRAMYLFPTKALAQDQLTELNRWTEKLGEALRTFTYDGDTPADARPAIRNRANLVLTNPDMLHTGILPHHTRWERLFENLRYVVLDELHTYRGVFGSHLANVLRRLKRVAAFYGTRPQFIATSATIANPAELAARLTGEPVGEIQENGAPAAEKFFVFYNPPVVNPQLGIRRSYMNEARRIARTFMSRGLQTIVFANSRLATEVLVTYLREDFSTPPGVAQRVRGYRGGYLPLERRAIERDLREGRLLGVVATNALELGIDIGSLDVAVLAAYPGTIASTWQRAGRAGRRDGASAAVLVASSAPLDQFMAQNPDYFFSRSPEHGLINPDNLEILLNHLKCAAFELPLREDENFGGRDLARLCRHLEELGFLHRTSEGWHWVSESYPADAVSLRSVSSDSFVIVDETSEPRAIGEVDFSSALTTVHEKAIYMQDGRHYHVERLDYHERKAYVRECQSDYFTDAISYTKIKVLETFDSAAVAPPSTAATRDDRASAATPACNGRVRSRDSDGVHRTPAIGDSAARAARPTKNHGEVRVNTQVVGFKKIKFGTMENLGSGELSLPEQETHTTAYWLTLPADLLRELPYSSDERLEGVGGLARALQAIATLLLMCDARDLGVAIGENSEIRTEKSEYGSRESEQSGLGNKDAEGDMAGRVSNSQFRVSDLQQQAPSTRSPVPVFYEPNIYLYDAYPGGIGFSEPLFRLSEELLENTRRLIENCPCTSGCPSCVGPAGEVGEKGKEVTLAILKELSVVRSP